MEKELMNYHKSKKNNETSEEKSDAGLKSEHKIGFDLHFDAVENMRFNPYDTDLQEVVKERIKKLSQEIPASDKND